MYTARVAFPVIIQLDFEIFCSLLFLFERNYQTNVFWRTELERQQRNCGCCLYFESSAHTHTSPASSTTFSVFALRSENNKTPHVGCLFLRPCRHRVRVGRWEHCLFFSRIFTTSIIVTKSFFIIPDCINCKNTYKRVLSPLLFGSSVLVGRVPFILGWGAGVEARKRKKRKKTNFARPALTGPKRMATGRRWAEKDKPAKKAIRCYNNRWSDLCAV